MTPVKDEDGDIKNFTIRINGKLARCPHGCGCNVYHKPDDTQEELYECNSCGGWFETE